MKKYIPIAEMLWFQEGPGVRNTQYTSSGVKLLNVANLVDGVLDITNTDRYISEDEAYNRYKHFLVDDGDLIIASSGIKVEYFDKKMGFAKKEQLPLCMNTSTIRFKVLNKEQVSIRYFMYYLKSEHFKEQLNHQITGSAQLNFGPSHLKKMLFPIVEMETQQQIVRKLDVLHGIENRLRQELSLLDQLVKSRFIELFGDPDGNPMNWETAELERHLEIVGGFAFKSEGFADSGIPVLRIGNINSGHFLPVNMVFWPEDPSLARYKMYPGDLVMSLTGTVGKDDYGNVCVLSDEYPEYYLNQRNAKLAIGATLNRHYLSEMLKFSRIKKRLTGISRGVRQANISNRDILALRVPIPPIKLQEQFAAFVEQTDKSKYYSSLSFRYCQAAENAYRQEWITCRTSDF